ncbi:hemerythrin superfamily protein [Virgibacillus natechei]|uniref:Hemerythrin superfamily protein n=1 Tax=Virgibacillus natechei TaxID=1216297 RepID=A0ABS4IIW2_9BACI|nr:hemerythrin domain-containing protein [Virgibacillus natechei]MBP1969924.1 hemerythrin superfamily protein [Virgibacillus natechei]UZD13411.1 hemerythrin domain-containing protein [Virgibacillus natechei]
MSGPGLKHIDSHSAIHEAALNEAIELNEILEKLLTDAQLEKALETAYVAVEHWETRTLRHAESEEEGLYKELAEESPELKDTIIALTRDHDLLRLLVKEIKEMLDTDGFSDAVLQRFQALILVDLLHNEEEEKLLPNH